MGGNNSTSRQEKSPYTGDEWIRSSRDSDNVNLTPVYRDQIPEPGVRVLLDSPNGINLTVIDQNGREFRSDPRDGKLYPKHTMIGGHCHCGDRDRCPNAMAGGAEIDDGSLNILTMTPMGGNFTKRKMRDNEIQTGGDMDLQEGGDFDDDGDDYGDYNTQDMLDIVYDNGKFSGMARNDYHVQEDSDSDVDDGEYDITDSAIEHGARWIENQQSRLSNLTPESRDIMGDSSNLWRHQIVPNTKYMQ